jgi:PAS domain S-box-containing protein
MKTSKAVSDAGGLRRQSDRLQGPRVRNDQPEGEARRLLREREVHQFKLQRQDEELLRAREEIEAGEERYKRLFEFSPLGFVMLATGGRVRDVNPAGALLLRRERPSLAGASFVSLFAEEDGPAAAALLDRALRSEQPETCEVRTGPDRGSVQLRLTASSLADLLARAPQSAGAHPQQPLRAAPCRARRRAGAPRDLGDRPAGDASQAPD